MEKKYDLEERLINFACDCIDVLESLPKRWEVTIFHHSWFELLLPLPSILEKLKVQKVEMISSTK